MRVILHIIRKEFLQVLKDRPMLAVIFLMPMIQLFVLAFAITTDVKNIPLAVCDRDRTVESRALTQRFVHSRWFRITEVNDRPEDLHIAMNRGTASIVLVIDRGFSEGIAEGDARAIQLIVDGVDSNSALVGSGYARSIIMMHFAAQRNAHLPQFARIRAVYNPELESKFTMLPGIVALLLTIITMLLTALGLVREREIGTLEQLNVTPIRPIQLMIGKMVPFILLGGLMFVIALSAVVLVFHIPIAGSLQTLALVTGIYLLTTLGMGLLVSTAATTQQQALFLSWFILVMSILMSGFMFPISNMPEILQKVTYLIPLRYFIVALRDILLKGASSADLVFQIRALAILGGTIFTVSVLAFRKRSG